MAYRDLVERRQNLLVFDDFILGFQKPINSQSFVTISSDNPSFMMIGEMAHPLLASSLAGGSVCSSVKPDPPLLVIQVF